MAHRTIDLRGLLCPLTWVRVRRELSGLLPGDLLEVTVDHRPAVPDIRRNAGELGHEVGPARPLDDCSWMLVIEVGTGS
jgi:tRNA 2-thiouridine synthesizing protein A